MQYARYLGLGRRYEAGICMHHCDRNEWSIQIDCSSLKSIQGHHMKARFMLTTINGTIPSFKVGVTFSSKSFGSTHHLPAE